MIKLHYEHKEKTSTSSTNGFDNFLAIIFLIIFLLIFIVAFPIASLIIIATLFLGGFLIYHFYFYDPITYDPITKEHGEDKNDNEVNIWHDIFTNCDHNNFLYNYRGSPDSQHMKNCADNHVIRIYIATFIE